MNIQATINEIQTQRTLLYKCSKVWFSKNNEDLVTLCQISLNKEGLESGIREVTGQSSKTKKKHFGGNFYNRLEKGQSQKHD